MLPHRTTQEMTRMSVPPLPPATEPMEPVPTTSNTSVLFAVPTRFSMDEKAMPATVPEFAPSIVQRTLASGGPRIESEPLAEPTSSSMPEKVPKPTTTLTGGTYDSVTSMPPANGDAALAAMTCTLTVRDSPGRPGAEIPSTRNRIQADGSSALEISSWPPLCDVSMRSMDAATDAPAASVVLMTTWVAWF